MIAIDFGTGAALAIHGPDGPITKPKLPAVKGGKAAVDDFVRLLPHFLEYGDVVVESPTIGSSGCEIWQVEEIVANASNSLYVMSSRAVKNYRKDHGLGMVKEPRKYETDEVGGQVDAHASDAEIIYRISVETPERLKRWKPNDKFVRTHRSVRPYDKRGYRDPFVDELMGRAPVFEDLPVGLKHMFGIGKGTKDPVEGTSHPSHYSPAKVLPLLMALDEPGADTRTGYEKIIGLYDHAYPSFYRRKTIDLMQETAKRVTGKSRFEEVTREERKAAWRETRRLVRQFFHLTKGRAHETP